MDISVVIVSWNSQAIVAHCLEALAHHQTRYSFEVILVDNASSDGTPEMVEQRFPQVRLIRNMENLGFSKANNIGIRLATGRYVCLMNSDIVIREHCFDLMVKYLEKHPGIGILGPQLLNPDLSIQGSCESLPTLWNALCEALFLNKIFPRSRFFSERYWSFFKHDRICNVPVLPAAFWMIPQKVLERVGLLDERFFIYGEDNDFCRRLKDQEWKVVFYPKAEAIHYHGGSSSNMRVRFHLEQHRASLQYWQKHHGIMGVIGISSIRTVHYLLRLIPNLMAYFLFSKNRNDRKKNIRKCIYSILFYLGHKTRSYHATKKPCSGV